MWPFSQYTTAGRAALTYISIGALTVIWAGVWYIYLFNNPPGEIAYYWCTGFLVTGLAMILIGSVLGMISRSARSADLARAGVPLAAVNLQPNPATAPAPVLTPPDVAPPVVVPSGQVVLTPPNSLSPG